MYQENTQYYYYEITSMIEGEMDILFGSYDRNDCISELDADRDSWKLDGYSKFKIVKRFVDTAPDPDTYPDLAINS